MQHVYFIIITLLAMWLPLQFNLAILICASDLSVCHSSLTMASSTPHSEISVHIKDLGPLTFLQLQVLGMLVEELRSEKHATYR